LADDFERYVELFAAPPVTGGFPELVLIQAVAVTREDEDDGMCLEWLLEGGISELEFVGTVLFAMPEANDLCDENGSAEVYLAPLVARLQGDNDSIREWAREASAEIDRLQNIESDLTKALELLRRSKTSMGPFYPLAQEITELLANQSAPVAKGGV
jgi:hypothetical protein